MKRVAVVWILLLAAFTVVARQQSAVPVDREPAHHQVLDNAYVRVFDVVVPPRAATLMHRHDRDYIFVTLGDSRISNERLDAAPVQQLLKDGETRYARGGFAHVARNLAETPFHNITIELKNPGKAICGIDPAPKCENAAGAATSELMSGEHFTLRLTTLEPGQQTPVHSHPYPHLAIAASDLTLENHPVNGPVRMLKMSKGQVQWVDKPVTHSLKNVGKQRATLLALEFN